MELALILYVFTRLGALSSLFVVAAIFSVVGVIASLLVILFNSDPDRSYDTEAELKFKRDRIAGAKKYVNRFAISAIVMAIFVTATPSKEDAKLIASGYVVQTVAVSMLENERVRNIASKSVEMIEQWLEENTKKVVPKETKQPAK